MLQKSENRQVSILIIPGPPYPACVRVKGKTDCLLNNDSSVMNFIDQWLHQYQNFCIPGCKLLGSEPHYTTQTSKCSPKIWINPPQCYTMSLKVFPWAFYTSFRSSKKHWFYFNTLKIATWLYVMLKHQEHILFILIFKWYCSTKISPLQKTFFLWIAKISVMRSHISTCSPLDSILDIFG